MPKKIKYLKPELIKTILEYLMKEQKNNKSEFSYTLSFCFKLALYGGVRASEICNLSLNNFGKPYISKESKTKLIPLTIMGKSRTIYTNPIPYDYIKSELAFFIKIKSAKEKLFYSKTGLPLDRIKLYRYFEEISEKLNLGKKGIHIIRRTFATNLSEAGVDLIHIQNLMRHKDIKTTTIYTARSQSRMEEAVSRL
ncbi:tyrosine-type recombinase/integrase [Aliarcobacter skirrowii]|uniref:tyrosine-type recombinase/integrase n=1 Tax=Aliarcobacter skirrowii TaxID=28200 RepID=UPI0029C0CB2A|nr:tyrosine-type recombinase/integrase [Aliarcobacter skirrowii]